MKRQLGYVQPRMILAPSASTTAAANAGDWVDMAEYDSALMMIGCDPGAAGDDFAVNFRQGRTNTGTGAKDIVPRRVYRAEAAALSVGTAFAEVAPSTQDSLTNAVLLDGDQANLVIAEFTADELDVEGGYHYINFGHTAGAAAKLIAAFVVLGGARYAVDPTDFPDVS